jgi:hypothetical protein
MTLSIEYSGAKNTLQRKQRTEREILSGKV